MEKIMNVPFSPPDISDAEIEEVVKALKSGWITTGPRVKELEKELANYLDVGLSETGTPRCVCLNSQTACAEMCLRLLGVGEGDEVIVPAYTYTATASVVCHVGARPVMVDCEKDSFTLDYGAVERAVTEKTKVIIPVSLGGIPCDYKRLFSIAEKKRGLFKPSNPLQEKFGRIIILEDAAHSLGAKIDGKKVGSICDFTAFSFHAVKNFTTAEGGALTWNKANGLDDKEIYKSLQLLSLHGQSKDALNKNKPGMWEYDIVGPFYKCNMTDIMAAIGLKQLIRYPAMLKRREEIIKRYDKALNPLGVKTLSHYGENYSSSGHLYLARVFGKYGAVSDEKRREIVIKMAERGIATNVHYKPLPMHTAYKNLGFNIKDYPNAYSQYENEITLPLNTVMTDEQVDYVIKNFIEIIQENVDL